MKPLSTQEAVDLASYLSALARAGLPMAAGTRAVALDLRSGKVSALLGSLSAAVEAGQSLEEALEAHGAALPAHLRALMVVGARSGRLAETLDDLLAHEREMDDMGRRLWQAILYPAMLFSFLIVWVLFMALWLIPQLEMSEIISDMDELNGWRTSGLQQAQDFGSRLNEFARIVPVVIVAAFCAVVVTVGGAGWLGGRAAVSRLFARVPLVGPAWWYRALGEFGGLLAVFLRQNVPLGEALRMMSTAARDPAIRAAAAKAAEQVDAGRELSASLGEDALFPPTLLNVVQWGQRHGALGDAFESVHGMYRDRFELQLRLIRVVLPPIVFLLVVASALFVAMTWFATMGRALIDLT